MVFRERSGAQERSQGKAGGRGLDTPVLVIGLVAASFCLLGSVGVVAQTQQKNRLATAKSVQCTFTLYAVGTWDKDKGEPRAELKPVKLSVAFNAIDTDEGTAQAATSFGPAHIIAKLSLWSLHLMAIGNEGALQVTTVFDRETRDGKLRAVHTRHEYTDVSLPGFTSRPEQYYGECEVKD